ncbi:MAG: peptidoglycan DD-metalloendopeptidase family protein [Actinobacteria bacterium]|nr:peptidoglycan DD-metalloendopeptidase family protein [Actinomycetota bacterium]
MTLTALRRTAVFATIVATLLPATAIAQDLEEVEQQVEQLEDRLGEATARYEDTWARVSAAEEELATLAERTRQLEVEAAEVDVLLAARARAVFKHGGNSVLESLLSADGPQRAIERASLMNAVTGRDQGRLEAAVNLRVQLDQSAQLLAAKTAELEALKADLAEQQAALAAELDDAKVLQTDLRRREARRKHIERGVQNGTYACMFEHPFNFRDTWGHPRSGGRRHKGTDVFSYHGAPVYAFNGGRIQRLNNSGLGGISVYLWGEDGNLYYYTHLDDYAPGLHVGKYVEAGEMIAYNGDTGNARGGAPHVHFQLHPGGGAPVNPYPWLAAACF